MKETGYFVRRAPDASADFEESYWGVAVDPDGKRREPATERLKKLEDLQGELRFVAGLPPGRILDVGCGLGHLLSGVSDVWERHGVELSEYAAERAKAWGNIVVGDLRSARYPDDFFDVVTLYHVIEHMLDPVAELREIKRVLKPGGRLVLGTPNFDSGCARRFGERYRMLHDRTHISLFSEASLRRLLGDLGFTVQRVDFPFFETRYFNEENLQRLFNTERMSPPFYGNLMTFYCEKPARGPRLSALNLASRALARMTVEQASVLERAFEIVGGAGGRIHVSGQGAHRVAAALLAQGYRASAEEDPVLSEGDVVVALGMEAANRHFDAAGRASVPMVCFVSDGDDLTGEAATLFVPTNEASCLSMVAEFVLATAIPQEEPERLVHRQKRATSRAADAFSSGVASGEGSAST